MARLETYKRKRDFARTPEPAGGKAKGHGNSYVIHKHAATRLHYDLRLEMGGVLASWAVPKGPSLDPAEKHLAVHVEDHPLEYGDFEGTIPKGEYGGGTVMVWDRGTWEPVDPDADPVRNVAEGHLKFRLHGDKLHGAWMLVRMKRRSEEEGKDEWLLFKERDEEARTGEESAVTKTATRSAKTGREMEQIAAGEETWHSDKPRDKPSAAKSFKAKVAENARKAPKKPPVEAARIPGARESKLPRDLTPELPTLVADAPDGDEWVHEIKFDGYRMLAFIEDGEVRLVSRNGKDWTARLRPITDAVAGLPASSAVVDGEAVIMQESGITSFHELQEAMGASGDLSSLYFYVFDLPYLDGHDLTRSPLEERKRALAALVDASDGLLRYSDDIAGRGREFFGHACQMELEGIVSKRRGSAYKPGRQREWVKTKCLQQQEFVVGGYTLPSNGGEGIGALVIGTYDERGELRHNGRVGTGWTHAASRDLRRMLEPLERDTPAFADPPRGAGARGIRWVQPELVAEVSFAEWTRDGSLRHQSFRGLREDKPAREVVRERAHALRPAPGGDSRVSEESEPLGQTPVSPGEPPRIKKASKPPERKRHKGKEAIEVGGVTITNPDRVLWPDTGQTKQDLALYYERIAEWMVPRISGSVLTLVRCPEGYTGGCFYQKHAGRGMPPGIRRIPITESTGTEEHLYVDSLEGLLGLVQMGVMEVHLWASKVPAYEKPDHLTFDFDPDEDLPWTEVVRAARHLKERLDGLGFVSFPKTTGGKGLHVVCPLKPRRAGWEEVLGFARAVVEDLVAESPDRYTAKMTKARRVGKVYIDYLRNSRGASAIAPYSVRARPGAPVSFPLTWDEVFRQRKRPAFTLADVPGKLARLKADPWAGYEDVRQAVDAMVLKRAGAR